MSDDKSDENFFEQCAESRIRVNDLVERTEEILEDIRNMVGISEEEWFKLMTADELTMDMVMNAVNKTSKH